MRKVRQCDNHTEPERLLVDSRDQDVNNKGRFSKNDSKDYADAGSYIRMRIDKKSNDFWEVEPRLLIL